MQITINQVLTPWIEICTRFGPIVLHANEKTKHEGLTAGFSRLITLQE